MKLKLKTGSSLFCVLGLLLLGPWTRGWADATVSNSFTIQADNVSPISLIEKGTQADLQPLVNSTWQFTYMTTTALTDTITCGDQFDTVEGGGTVLLCRDGLGQPAMAGYSLDQAGFGIMKEDPQQTTFLFRFMGQPCQVIGLHVAYALDPEMKNPSLLSGTRIDCPGTSPNPPTTTTPSGSRVTDDLWIKASIHSVEKGPIEAVWKQGSDSKTLRGDRVIWGYFYANPADVSWGSENNPDAFVKVWYDVSGRIDVNFFHVSVPDIEVTSAMSDNVNGQSNVTTMSKRYARHTYGQGTPSSELLDTPETPFGLANANPKHNLVAVQDLQIGALIQTQERGAIEGVWHLGSTGTTARGDQVAWGFFYASPGDVSWGFENNPEVYVKVWYDVVAKRVDVNFFHVSAPDIDVYSGFSSGNYDNGSRVTTGDRYTRHVYQK